MTVATCVCCSMISETQIAYGSRVACHGRSWRPWCLCQPINFPANPVIEPRRSSAKQALQPVFQIAAAFAVPGAAQLLLDSFFYRSFELLFGGVSRERGEIEFVGRRIERTADTHR